MSIKKVLRSKLTEAAKESQMEISAILDNAPMIMVIVDQDLRIRKMSRALSKFVGRDENETIGLSGGEAIRCIHYMDDPNGCGFGPACKNCTVRKVVSSTIRTGINHQRIEARMTLERDGVGEWTFLVSTALLNLQKNRVLICIEDITERNKAEKALRESEERFRTLVEESPLGVSLIGDNGQYRYINLKFNEMFGYTLEDIYTGREWFRKAYPDREYRKRVISTWKKDKEESRVREARPRAFTVNCKDGSKKEIFFRPVSLYTKDQLIIYEDITERKQAEDDLKKSEERFRNLIEGSIQGILIHRDHKPLFVNQAWATIHKYTTDEILRMESVVPLISPKDQASMVEYKNTRMRGEDTPTHYEYQGLRKDGSLVWLENMVTIVQWDGKPAIQTILVDITERKRAEERIQEQYRFLKTLFDAIPFPFYLKDTNAKYLGCSPSYAEIIGVNTEEVVGKRAEDIFSDDIAAIHNQADQDLFQNPGTQVYEYRLKYADGSLHSNIVSKATYNDDNGNLMGMVGFYTDITGRNRAEEALRESEERYRLLFNSANDAVFVHQPSAEGKPSKFIEVNDIACKMYGYTREELLELTPLDLVISGQEEDARIWVGRLLSDKYSFFEIVHKASDGKEIPVEINAHLFDFKGRPTILSIVRDITDRKRSEAQLQQSQKMEAIGTLAGGIAHDFNNILSPLLGYAELLKEDLSDESPLQASVNEIIRASLRARDLVQQILAFSRQTEDELKPIRIHPAVKEAIKLLRASLPKTIDIEQNIDPDCGAVTASPTQIHQIVMNLATNAYHAMEDSAGTLKVLLKQFQIEPDQSESKEIEPGTYACLTVSDTGVGIEKDILDKIFDPYFTTKEKNKGTGLGLSVVHGIVKNYGGDIHIYSEPGKGTEVHVYLPIIESKIEEGAKDSIESIQGGTEKILLVDDEEAIVRVEQQMLEGLGYEVSTRAGSVDALEAFKANPDRYDLIITDMTMPNMTGIRLAQEIKKIRPEIPVIICTGFSDQIDKEKCKAMSIQGYVMKPIVRKEFAGTIREVLDRSVPDRPLAFLLNQSIHSKRIGETSIY